MCHYQWLCWTLTPVGHGEHLSLGNWTEGPFRSSFNLWGPNLSSPTPIEPHGPDPVFSSPSFLPHHGPLKAGEKLECACSVWDNGGVSDPWPSRLRPFFLDQALPFATVGYCPTAWQQKEGKHLLRFLFSGLTTNFFSFSVAWDDIFFSFRGFVSLLKDERGLRQVPCLNFRLQLYNQSSWQLFASGPKRTGVTVSLSTEKNTQDKGVWMMQTCICSCLETVFFSYNVLCVDHPFKAWI